MSLLIFKWTFGHLLVILSPYVQQYLIIVGDFNVLNTDMFLCKNICYHNTAV